MTPFKITCVTCRARLAVRSEALIGQILACPKCGSMVQVTPPPGGAPDSATGSSIVLTPQSAPPPPAAADVDASPSATFDDVAGITAPINSEATRPGPPPDAGAAVPPPPAVPAVGLSGMKLALLAGSAALAGSALVAAMMWSLRGAPENAATSGAPARSPALVADAASATDAPPAIDAAPVVEEAAASDPAPAVADAAETGLAPAPTDDTPFAPPADESPLSAADAAADAPLDSAPPPTPTPPGVAATVTDGGPVSPVEDLVPRLTIDPLNVDPEGLDLRTLTRGPAADPLAASNAAEGPAAPPGGSMAPAAADAGPPAEPAPIRFEPAGPPANVESLLARKLPAVAIDKMPLCRFLDFATDLSGLPVSVAPAELRLAAVSAATPVSVAAEDATMIELLTTALKPLRLAPSVFGPQIVLVRIDADKRRELVYPVDDLAASDDERRRLADWLMQLVAPDSWKAHGGDGALAVDGSALRLENVERVGYETLLLLEQYRLAAGLRPRSKYPAELLPQPNPPGELAERLAGPATFTFSQPTPLREVVRWWQEELQTAILVDWPALADQRTWPQSRITASAQAQPWGEALSAALEPLGAGWRMVDGRTIEITSLDRLSRELVLYAYRLAPVAAARGDEVIAQAQKLAATAGVDAGAALLDARRNVLLVRQPAFVHQTLAAWLAAEGLLPVD